MYKGLILVTGMIINCSQLPRSSFVFDWWDCQFGLAHCHFVLEGERVKDGVTGVWILLIVFLMKEQKMLYGQAAAQVTHDTLEAHGVQADIIVTDLVRGLEDQLSGAVDVLLFNPPYVPTPEHEVIQCLPSL
jgi:hypothetical protein